MGVDGDSTCSYQSVGQTFGEQTRLNGKKSGMNVMLSKLSSLINKKKSIIKTFTYRSALVKTFTYRSALELSIPSNKWTTISRENREENSWKGDSESKSNN